METDNSLENGFLFPLENELIPELSESLDFLSTVEEEELSPCYNSGNYKDLTNDIGSEECQTSFSRTRCIDSASYLLKQEEMLQKEAPLSTKDAIPKKDQSKNVKEESRIARNNTRTQQRSSEQRAYSRLREIIPTLSGIKKASKLDILRHALMYIKEMKNLREILIAELEKKEMDLPGNLQADFKF